MRLKSLLTLCPVRSPFKLTATVKRFRMNEDGVTAIEFGIIALPFFALIFAIIESGLYFFASQVMDTGFREAARKIRTGEAQTWTQQQMRDEICTDANKSSGLFTCENIFVDLREVDFAAGMSVPEPTTGASPKAFNSAAINYTENICGGKTVLMRAYYKWPSFVDILGSPLARLNDGTILMSSTAAFKTEPFGGC